MGLTRGEIILVAFIFGLIYLSGFLSKITARLEGKSSAEDPPPPEPSQKGE